MSICSMFPLGKLAFQVRTADWSKNRDALSMIRRRVFIQEQQVPEEMEWDEDDSKAQHFLILNAAGQAIGCARLLPDGHFGRMAVLPGWRHQGAGRALMQAALTEARVCGHSVMQLSAQTQAVGFYARQGFQAVGPEYWEAGLRHVPMEKKL